MISYFIYILFFFNLIISLNYPWIGIVITALFSILTPHNIWFWAFKGIRPIAYLVFPVVVGSVLLLLRNKISFKYIKSKLFFAIFLLWLTLNLSFLFGPYVNIVNEYRFFDPSFVVSNLNKTLISVFFVFLLIDNLKKIKCLVGVFLTSCIYMIYWANKQYFIENVYGRLRGPEGIGVSIYGDENAFAMFFVVTLPFLYFMSSGFDKKIIRYSLLALIPFGWHAVFLTGSRGGMLALFLSFCVMSLRSSNKILKVSLVPVLIIAFLWQGGDLLKKRMDTISSYQSESSAASRIEAWSAAVSMMNEHPFTGVGVGSFGQAFPDFSNKEPRIAHNTYLQLSSESGILSGLLFLFIVFYPLVKLYKITNSLKCQVFENNTKIIYLIAESCISSIVGFFICSLFLSLQEFDIFYFLIAISNFVIIYYSDFCIKNQIVGKIS